MLCRSHFVVLGFSKDAQLPKLFIKVFHICLYSRLNYSEIVVIHLLTLGRTCTKKGAAGINKVFALIIHLFIYKEILLLRTDTGVYILYSGVSEKSQNTQRLTVKSFH